MLVDISERKRAEEATQRLASIVESSDDAIDLDGILIDLKTGELAAGKFLAMVLCSMEAPDLRRVPGPLWPTLRSFHARV
jgi:hypothetical protein